MRRLRSSIPTLPQMRNIVQAETRVFVTNTGAEVKNNIIYWIPPKRTVVKKGTEREKATVGTIIYLSKHI